MKSKEVKQKEAKERDESYSKLTLDEKIKRQLDKGYSGKQLSRLLELRAKRDKKE